MIDTLRRKRLHLAVMIAAAIFLRSAGPCLPASFREQTGADAAEAKYAASGAGVAIAIMDRGIDWDHPDFINPDGTTRIKWLYDMSPVIPVEYSEAQINAALHGGPTINERDAVGHGTITTGLAAGNGSAFGGGAFRGMAPKADLIIVKMTSEGAPAHGSQPAENPFNKSNVAALNWLEQKINALNEPVVGIFNSGTQYGPIDGTSGVSRRIDEIFGPSHPGRVYVAASGDEGEFANHARATFGSTLDTTVDLVRTSADTSDIQMWYTGNAPATIKIVLDDGTTVGPVSPGQTVVQSGVEIYHYNQHQTGLDERLDTSGDDRLVFVRITGHAVGGHVVVHGTTPAPGTIDLYSAANGSVPFLNHTAPGRLSDYASTHSAIVAGAHVLQTDYVDVDGIARSIAGEGAPGELWTGSSGGPTRDGRSPGVDVTAPGQNAFAAYAQESYWETFRGNLIQGGGQWYGRGGATSGSAPIVVGAVAMLLEAAPDLTVDQVRELLHSTATSDGDTGPTPNADWGYGKLNVLAALDAVCAQGLAKVGYCGLPGDFNKDDKVDAADYLVWRKNPSGFPLDGYATWRANFGSILPASGAAQIAAVPETRTLSLLSVAAGILSVLLRVPHLRLERA